MKKLPIILIEKEILEDLYFNKEYSITMIEKELNIKRIQIEYLFKLYSITKKTMSETISSKVVRKQTEDTNLKNYGFVTPIADVEKMKKIKFEKYGDENYCNKEKIKDTCINKYNKTSYLATNECKKILNNKYNVKNNIFESEEIKEKSRKTKLERYGDKNYTNTKKYKKTCLEKYNVDNPSKLEEIKQKKINTSIERYNVEYPWQTDKIRNKVIKTLLEKYNVTNR
jgi:hypothetical protein